MIFPESCPVCRKGPIRLVLEDYSIMVSNGAEQKRIGGLSAFQCTQELHIFFLRTKDVEEQTRTESGIEERKLNSD